jgi:hypothetical protein
MVRVVFCVAVPCVVCVLARLAWLTIGVWWLPQPQQQLKPLFAPRARKVDTNVLTVGLGSLAEDVPMMTGDPVFCKGCSAIFNSFRYCSSTHHSHSSLFNSSHSNLGL